ncbi:MAG: hypothetical protein DLM52_01105 [Chthoniobacterales bacterium]|nr:MAG: hypothetical protein DLM52_01105 [Chthoniobacterales bacterium]
MVLRDARASVQLTREKKPAATCPRSDNPDRDGAQPPFLLARLPPSNATLVFKNIRLLSN